MAQDVVLRFPSPLAPVLLGSRNYLLPCAQLAPGSSSVFWLLLCFGGDPSYVKGKKGLGWGGQQTAWLGPLGTSAPEAGLGSFPCEARGMAVTLSQGPVASWP